MPRGGRRGQCGVVTVELVASLGVLLLVVLLVQRLVVAARLEARAESDARALVRLAALCDPSRPLRLDSVDADYAAGTGSYGIVTRSGDGTVTARVQLEPTELVQRGAIAALGWVPRAAATMALEPGCAHG